MTRSLRLLAAAVLVLSLANGPVVAAEAPPPPSAQERAEKALKEGVAHIMRALEMLIQSVPIYEMPEVLDNGDIIIRRKRPGPKDAPGDEDGAKT